MERAMNLNITKEWLEGRRAFADGIEEMACPYNMFSQWEQWVDWVCGHGEALHESWRQKETTGSKEVAQ